MAKEITFFDSSILIAASLPEHPHHPASNSLLASLPHGGGACASHTLAETYNTLTKYPGGYGIPPEVALSVIQHASKSYKLISLTPEETLRTVADVTRLGLIGSVIYDALLLACARKIGAKRIYTFNSKHFRRVAPDLADRILEP